MGQVLPSPRQRSIGIKMCLRYSSFRKVEDNGLISEDLVSRALYRRGAISLTVISYIQMFDE